MKSLEASVGTDVLVPNKSQTDIETSGTNLAATEPGGLFQSLSIPQKSIALQAKEKSKPLSLPQKIGGGIAVALCLFGVIYLLSGFIFSIETPSGQLVVNVTGDDFKTQIKGQKVKITNTKTGDEYTITLDDSKTMEPLANGKYQFEVETNSGLKFQQDEFTITQGENSEVSVHWVPKQVSPDVQETILPSTIEKWVPLLENEEQLKQWTVTMGEAPTIKDGTLTQRSASNGESLLGRVFSTDAKQFIVHVRYMKSSGFGMTTELHFMSQKRGLGLSHLDTDRHERWVHKKSHPDTKIVRHISLDGYREFIDSDFVVIDGQITAYLNGKKIGFHPFTEESLKQMQIKIRVKAKKEETVGQRKDIAVMRLSKAQVEAIRRGRLPKYPVSNSDEPSSEDKSVQETLPTSQQAAAVTEFKKLGGKVTLNQSGEVISVFLSRTKITDAKLEHLKGMTNLTELHLENTKVTGVGLVHLKSMTSLKTLYLDHTQVTDAGLEHLKGMTSLNELYFDYRQITDAGLSELRAALPKCTIYKQ